jgi:hypothetical protein
LIHIDGVGLRGSAFVYGYGEWPSWAMIEDGANMTLEAVTPEVRPEST